MAGFAGRIEWRTVASSFTRMMATGKWVSGRFRAESEMVNFRGAVAPGTRWTTLKATSATG